MERFHQQQKKLKIGFTIVFSILARKGLGVFFHARVLIFSPNALYLPTKQPWGLEDFAHLSEQATPRGGGGGVIQLILKK